MSLKRYRGHTPSITNFQTFDTFNLIKPETVMLSRMANIRNRIRKQLQNFVTY